MDAELFDTLTCPVPELRTRRGALAALLGGMLGLLGVADTDAKKKKKKGKGKGRGNDNPTASSPPPPPTSPPPVSPPVTLADAACLAPGPTGPTTYESGPSHARLAQTFTPLRSGQLVTAQVTIVKEWDSTGDYVATINTVNGSGVPTDLVLATASIPNADVLPDESSPTFTFPVPAPVGPEAQLALVISRIGGDSLKLRGALGNRCTGGAFRSLPQAEPFTPREDVLGFDFDYATFVRG